MKGIEFAKVRDAILSAFNADEFDMFLYERFGFLRQNFVADGAFKKIVFDVLRSAEQQGWDALLIYEVAKVRPLRPDIQQVYRNYGLALVDEARRETLDASVTQALERFRVGPSVMVQRSGSPQLPSPVLGTEAGFEKNVKSYLPFIKVGLWRQQLFAREGQVCRVELGERPIGTGFLVGPDTIITNFHVLREAIEAPALAPTVRFRFDYQELANGVSSEGTVVDLAVQDWLIDYTPLAKNEGSPAGPNPTPDQLDFAIVRLERAFGAERRNPANPEGTPRGWIHVPSTPPLISSDPPMPILILEHPETQPLKLAVDTAAVLGVFGNGTRIRYTTNTERGSSGSPCFNIEWTLIALHHYGDPAHDHAEFNQGILVHKIRERLERVGKVAAALGGPSPA